MPKNLRKIWSRGDKTHYYVELTIALSLTFPIYVSFVKLRLGSKVARLTFMTPGPDS